MTGKSDALVAQTYDSCDARAVRGKKDQGPSSGMVLLAQDFIMSDFNLSHMSIKSASSNQRLLPPNKTTMASQKYFALGILFMLNTINFVDRYSTAAVVTHIQAYYNLKNFQGGLLSLCFLLGYMLTAPIFGHLGDKYTRKWMLIGGITFWSFAAFSGSIINSEHYILFFISRILVGVGEASYSTIAPTIIADFFEPEKRKFSLSIFYFAIPIGSGLGYLMGTLAISLGDWRWIFRITPVLGIVAVGFLMFLQEPIRGQLDGSFAVTSDTSTVLQNIKYLASIKSYVWSTIGFTCCLFTTGAESWWAISFMGVARGQDYEKTATMIFGITVCLAGFVGVSLGSASAQYFRKYDGRADTWVCAAGVLVAIPLTVMGLFFARPVTWLSWIFLFFGVTALSTNWAVVCDISLSVTLPNKRAFATAMQILITHLFGDATSPTIIGFLRDELNVGLKDEYQAYLYALMSTLLVLALGGGAFLYSARFYVQDVESCKSTIALESEDAERTRSTDESNLTDFASIT